MQHPAYVVLEKPVGKTPLECIERWKAMHPEFASLPATYAGRLDPMASGKLLVLLGGECKKREQYTELDKEYEIEVVLDLSTDTGDALGLASYLETFSKPEPAQIRRAFHSVSGAHTVAYPAFSSKTVNGTPLFLCALKGELASIEIPTHTENIYRAKLDNLREISKEELSSRLMAHLETVPASNEPSKTIGADFRQADIRKQWQEAFSAMPSRSFTVLTLRVTCASGTYMRTLASRIARELGTSAFALSIHRTKIGRYAGIGQLGFWIQDYT